LLKHKTVYLKVKFEKKKMVTQSRHITLHTLQTSVDILPHFQIFMIRLSFVVDGL